MILFFISQKVILLYSFLNFRVLYNLLFISFFKVHNLFSSQWIRLTVRYFRYQFCLLRVVNELNWASTYSINKLEVWSLMRSWFIWTRFILIHFRILSKIVSWLFVRSFLRIYLFFIFCGSGLWSFLFDNYLLWIVLWLLLFIFLLNLLFGSLNKSFSRLRKLLLILRLIVYPWVPFLRYLLSDMRCWNSCDFCSLRW